MSKSCFSIFFILLWATIPAMASETAVPPDAVTRPDLAVGDWWINNMEGTTRWWREKITEIQANGSYAATVGNEGFRREYTADQNVRLIELRRDVLRFFEPHNYRLSFPLFPGKTWSGSYIIYDQWNRPYARETVVATAAPEWENVTWKLRKPESREVTLEVLRINYVLESDVNTRDMTYQCWYAPEVKEMIRCKYPDGSPISSWALQGYQLSEK